MADEVPSIGIILLLVCRCSRHSEKTRKTCRSAKGFEKERSFTHGVPGLKRRSVLMESEKKIRRDPQPALIAPTGHRYVPLYCATQWIATAGHSVDWDVVADELWHQAYRALCDAIASEEVKIIGEHEGETKPVPAFLFANCEISHHANLFIPDDGEFYLSSCPY